MEKVGPFEIIFQNKDLILVNKPGGYLSVPGRFGEKDERPVVGKLIEKELGTQIFPIHRLDYEVSGLLLFAKSALAHKDFNALFENKKIEKIYQAKTEGLAPSKNEFEWKSKILRGKKRAYESPAGKSSLTKAQFIRATETGLIWKLWPVTGRPHQLRFDLARHGYPILGDKLYGSKIEWSQPENALGIALRACELTIPKDTAEKWQMPEHLSLPGFV